jgi:hypothetical protein
VTAVALLLVALAATPAPSLPARDTARIGELGRGAVGLFGPLRWALDDDLELETHPLAFALVPNLALRQAVLRGAAAPLDLTLELGLALPWSAHRLAPPLGLRGFFSPSCAVAADEPARGASCRGTGTYLVPRFALVASRGREDVTTLRLDAALGVRLEGERAEPIDAWPVLDLLLAPVHRGHRVRLGVRHDVALLERLRVTGELSVAHVGAGPAPGRSPWIFTAWLGADLGLTERLRASLGVIVYDADQQALAVETAADGFSRFVPVRSRDVLPTLDLVWVLGDPR